MNALDKRTNAAPLSAEQAAEFRRLLAGADAVVTGERRLVLRSPVLEVVVSVWPAEEEEEEGLTPPVDSAGLPPPRELSSPALAAVSREGGAAATPEVLAELTRLLSSEDGALRAAASRAIRDLGSVAATPEILARLPLLLRAPKAEVRDAAAAALGSLGNAAATPAVIAALAPLVFDADWRIGAAAAEAVSRMRCSAAIEEYLRNTPSAVPESQAAARSSALGEGEIFDVLISAFAPGGKHVRLDGIHLHARVEDEAGVILPIVRLSRRGDFMIDGLPAGAAVRLTSPLLISPPWIPSWEDAGWAAEGAAEGPALPQSRIVESTDGSVRGMLRFLTDGTAVVVFETTEPRWADALVRFALVQQSGRVECEGEARLERVRDGFWEGRAPEGLRSPASVGLVFEVLERIDR